MTTPPDSSDGRLGLAFPGQGVPMADIVATLTRHADRPEPAALAEMLGSGRWNELDFKDTRVTQPAVYTASVLEASALRVEDFSLALGHSLGEIAALQFAGAVSFDAGLRLVAARSVLCEEVAAKRPGEMVAIMNLADHDVEFARRVALARTPGVLELAAVNGRQQIVLTGDRACVDAVIEEAAALGGMASRLPIGGAFHSPLMVPVLDRYREVLATVTFGPLRIDVASPTDCGVHDDASDFEVLLLRALVVPVRWVPLLESLRTAGVTELVEAGPGRTLEKLGRRTQVIPFTRGRSSTESR